MTWAPVAAVRRLLRSDTAHQPECRIVAEYGPAAVIDQTPKHGTSGHTDLTARAVRVCNRKPEAVKRYLAVHASLICSGARE